LQPQIEAEILKAAFLDSNPASEVVFQSFEFPLAAFVKSNPAFKPGTLTTVRFIFDRTPAGVVILDNVGFRSSDTTSPKNNDQACSRRYPTPSD